MQFVPLTGDGLVHVLSLVLTPCEHETEQLVQWLHSEKFPSTINFKNKGIVDSKLKPEMVLSLSLPPSLSLSLSVSL